ncbi:hypothetical protein [Collimonas antrihumi]|uniref:hypothetical protein n=1 Tax=Collimonas antrihumi TaxID=1940615 RepID=UPI001B8BFCF1|nr:hypothetical protein [Collimonas antrihumi]
MRDEKVIINGPEASYAMLGTAPVPLEQGGALLALRLKEKMGTEQRSLVKFERKNQSVHGPDMSYVSVVRRLLPVN